MKLLITVSVVLFGGIGAWLGGMLDGGNAFGAWSFALSTIGSFVGIWAGFKAGKSWLG